MALAKATDDDRALEATVYVSNEVPKLRIDSTHGHTPFNVIQCQVTEENLDSLRGGDGVATSAAVYELIEEVVEEAGYGDWL